MRTWTRGIRARRSTTAWSRSASRLRGYIRATESTVGGVAGRRVARGRREERTDVVEPAVERVKVGPHAQGAHPRDVAKTLEAADEAVESDERAAARGGRERCGGEEREAHAGG